MRHLFKLMEMPNATLLIGQTYPLLHVLKPIVAIALSYILVYLIVNSITTIRAYLDKLLLILTNAIVLFITLHSMTEQGEGRVFSGDALLMILIILVGLLALCSHSFRK